MKSNHQINISKFDYLAITKYIGILITNIFSFIMERTVKASNILIGSGQIFTSYQVDMADKIYNLLLEKNFKELGNIVNSIPTKADYEYIHYAFYDKHEFGWLAYVEKQCSYYECIKYGLYNYNY